MTIEISCNDPLCFRQYYPRALFDDGFICTAYMSNNECCEDKVDRVKIL